MLAHGKKSRDQRGSYWRHLRRRHHHNNQFALYPRPSMHAIMARR
jgi:hypothetical protein